MSQIHVLYRLQKIDTEIIDKKKALLAVLHSQKDNAHLELAKSEYELANNELRKWQTQQNNLNLELQSVLDKINTSEKRLYSGNVKNPKELADLQKGISSLKRRSAQLEDAVLEAMLEVEEVQKAEQALEQSLSNIDAKWTQTLQRLQKEQKELALRVNELLKNRKKQETLVPADSLAKYELVKKRRGGVAVVALNGNRCLGCGVTVPANLIKLAREGEIAFCGSCNRMMCPA